MTIDLKPLSVALALVLALAVVHVGTWVWFYRLSGSCSTLLLVDGPARYELRIWENRLWPGTTSHIRLLLAMDACYLPLNALYAALTRTTDVSRWSPVLAALASRRLPADDMVYWVEWGSVRGSAYDPLLLRGPAVVSLALPRRAVACR